MANFQFRKLSEGLQVTFISINSSMLFSSGQTSLTNPLEEKRLIGVGLSAGAKYSAEKAENGTDSY